MLTTDASPKKIEKRQRDGEFVKIVPMRVHIDLEVMYYFDYGSPKI